jgi:hypothetical protein
MVIATYCLKGMPVSIHAAIRYMECDECTAHNVTRGTVAVSADVTDTSADDHERQPTPFHPPMATKTAAIAFAELADRLLNPDGTAIISYASLGRIEQGVQPYSQEALRSDCRRAANRC